MKRTLLSIIAVAGISALSFGQVEILEGTTHVEGQTLNYTSAGSEVVVDLHIENVSGSTGDMTIRRVRQNPIGTWTDYVCWGHETDPFGGTCYPNDPSDDWTTPTAVTIPDTEGGTLSIHINPNDPDFGCGDYAYYVMDGQTALDSVFIQVCKTASIEDLTPALSVSVAPNPASEYVTVKANGTDEASLKIVDVLGNVVMKETNIGTSKTVNVARFKNGIYFVIVDAPGAKAINRKIIVRH